MKLCSRKDVPAEQKWDLSLIYTEEKLMWEDLEKTKAAIRKFIESYSGQLTSAANIVSCLDTMEKIRQVISRIWDYSGMPCNLLGQICLPYFLLWHPVSLGAILLDAWLRAVLPGTEKRPREIPGGAVVTVRFQPEGL